MLKQRAKLDTCVAMTLPLLAAGTAAAQVPGGYCPPQFHATGNLPMNIAVADMNGDGKSDIVVPNAFSNNVSVLLGLGDGTFGMVNSFATAMEPVYASIVQLNGDAYPDIVTACFSGGQMSVLLGNGDGTFAPAVSYAVGLLPHGLAFGDCNGDGNVDAVIAEHGAPFIRIRLGNGDGTFGPLSSFGTGVTSNGPVAVALADFDGDHDLDVVGANYYSSNVSILMGNGDGTFGPPTTRPAGIVPRSVITSDLNSDGAIDILVPNEGQRSGSPPGDVRVLLGDGTGGFAPALAFPAGNGCHFLALTDLDFDGRSDLVVANIRSDDVSILKGNGDGSFQPPINVAAGDDARAVGVADFDADGLLDFAVAIRTTGGASVILQRCPGGPLAIVPYCAGDGASNGGPDCPCGNNVAPGVIRGCTNSTGNGGKLVASGNASLSADTVTLTGSDMAPASFSLFVQSPSTAGGGYGQLQFFDGLRCIGPSFVRLTTKMSVSGAAAIGSPSTPISVLGGVASPGTQYYQVVYRNNAGLCNFLANATNGVAIVWGP